MVYPTFITRSSPLPRLSRQVSCYFTVKRLLNRRTLICRCIPNIRQRCSSSSTTASSSKPKTITSAHDQAHPNTLLHINVPSPDAVILGIIPLGLLLILGEAYLRTDLADAELPQDCTYDATSLLIKSHHVRALEQKGWVVIPMALNETSLRNARQDLFQFLSDTAKNTNKEEKKTDNAMELSSNDADVRQDRVAWFKATSNKNGGIEEGDSETIGKHMDHCVRLIRGVAQALTEQQYDDGTATTTTSTATKSSSVQYRVPTKCQFAWYSGDGSSIYHRHLDQCRNSIWELGLLEWLRLSDYRRRAVTVILYLNLADRPTSEGGALRCWVEKDQSDNDDVLTTNTNDSDTQFQAPFDIQPKGGTMVIFQSNKVEHMVTASTVDRFAITSWISRTSIK